MRILGICGSLQAGSSNLRLLEAAARAAPPGVELAIFEGLRELPHFDPDLEAGGAPDAVAAWRKALAESAALLIAAPEYGHSLPGVLKNAVDWVIGTGELERKIVAITAAVTHPDRGRMGLAALRQTLNAVSAVIVGGDPIVRGPNLERGAGTLLAALVQRAREPLPDFEIE